MFKPGSKSGVGKLLADLNTTRFGFFDDQEPRERRAALLGRIAEYGIVSIVSLVLAAMEIGRWYFKTAPQPILMGGFAGGVVLYAAVRVGLILPQIRVLNRERHARRDLREEIARLCDRGYMLFEGGRDGSGRAFCALLGPAGLFSLTRRIVPRGADLSETVEWGADGRLTIGGREVLADPLGQARQAAADLRTLLEAEGARDISVRPTLVFPGWTVTEKSAPESRDVMVVSEWTLAVEIRAAPPVLEPAQVIAASLALERLVRVPSDVSIQAGAGEIRGYSE